MISSPPPRLSRGTIGILAAGTILHRLHDKKYPSVGFNPGTGPSQSRFAPIMNPAGVFIPTLYAAESFECAAHESVFHDIVPDQAVKRIPLSRLEPVRHSLIQPARALAMVQLFEPDLNAWQLTRQELIDTLPIHYAATARWAEAIHAAHEDVHGMVWTSRRCDPGTAYVFFGDRLSAEDLAPQRSVDLTADDTELRAVIGFGRRAGIDITL